MRQAIEEKSLSVTGGILAGETWLTSRSYTFPLVSCTVSAHGITLFTWCPPRFHFYIPKESIRQLVFKDYRIAGFLRIIHDVEKIPRYIRFGTFDVRKLRRVLETLHFELSVL
jgi:hypothetical protein